MQDFVLHHPTKIIFGRHALSNLATELNNWPGPLLLVYGQASIHRSGLYETIVAALAAANMEFHEHGGIGSNPTLAGARAGIATAIRHHCQGVLAVGGGSVIDTAKAIAAGCCVNHDLWKLFTGKKPLTRSLPVLAVPTVAGSGSEYNGGMVLTHEEKKRKFGYAHRLLFPHTSLVDPSLTISVPPAQTLYGAVDILTHCLEVYLSTELETSPLQRRLLESVSKTTIEACCRLLRDPFCYEDRATMLWAGSLALSGIMTAGVGRIAMPLHALEHALSVREEIPHGAGLAALLPGWLAFQIGSFSGRLAAFGRAVFAIDAADEAQAAALTVTAIESFLEAGGSRPRLSEWAITIEQIPELTAHCREQAAIWRLRGLPPDLIEAALRYCLKG